MSNKASRIIFTKTAIEMISSLLSVMCRGFNCPRSRYFNCPFEQYTEGRPLSIDDCNPTPEQWRQVLQSVLVGETVFPPEDVLDLVKGDLKGIQDKAASALRGLARETGEGANAED